MISRIGLFAAVKFLAGIIRGWGGGYLIEMCFTCIYVVENNVFFGTGKYVAENNLNLTINVCP